MQTLHNATESLDIVDTEAPEPEDKGFKRYRGATIGEALETARAEHGTDVEILEANRIRRGGVGGFFSTDLGVEVLVASNDAGEAKPGHISERHDFLGITADDEYLDTATLNRSAPVPSAQPSTAGEQPANHSQPRFFDRIHEETQLDTTDHGLQRLLTAAARAEETEQQVLPERQGSRTLSESQQRADPEQPTFADHLDREISLQSGTEPALPKTLPRSEPGPAVLGSPPIAPSATPIPPAKKSATRTSRGPRDPHRRPIELATSAVGHLVEQISELAPSEGSRIHDLSRLTVSVTTPDGSVIEMSAVLNRDSNV